MFSPQLVKRVFLELRFPASSYFLTTEGPAGCRYLVLEYCAGGDVLDNLLSNGIMDEMACEAQVRQALRKKSWQ